MIELSDRIREEIVAHARAEAPNECCGLLGGVGHEVRTVYMAVNASADPRGYFEIAPREQFDLIRTIEAAGEILLGVYHSHPRAPAVPSPTDRRYGKAWGSSIDFVIVSLEAEEPDLWVGSFAG